MSFTTCTPYQQTKPSFHLEGLTERFRRIDLINQADVIESMQMDVACHGAHGLDRSIDRERGEQENEEESE